MAKSNTLGKVSPHHSSRIELEHRSERGQIIVHECSVKVFLSIRNYSFILKEKKSNGGV